MGRRNRKRGEDGKERGGGRQKERKNRGGEKLDADNHAATFFFLLVYSGRNPEKIKDKEGRGEKNLHVG